MKMINFFARLNSDEISGFYAIMIISMLACIGIMLGVACI